MHRTCAKYWRADRDLGAAAASRPIAVSERIAGGRIVIWAPLLLADPSPSLRWHVLRELLGRGPRDPEVRELDGLRQRDPLVADLLALQGVDGSWVGSGINATGAVDRAQATSIALARLGFLGMGPEHPAVQRGAEYLFSRQRRDGAWPLVRKRCEAENENENDRGYSMVPLQTTLPLRGLAMCGFATDSRCEQAFEWLLSQRLEDGAWPTGIAAGNYGRVVGYRKLAHSRWGCRSNTTGALSCLALHPERSQAPETRRALDLLLGRDTHDRYALGHEVARLIGVEPARGFIIFYARFDAAQILDLCWRIGATLEDERVAGLVTFIREQQGQYGLWEYRPKLQASRWITLDLLRSLSRLDETGEWVSSEPPTPFQAYARKRPRY